MAISSIVPVNLLIPNSVGQTNGLDNTAGIGNAAQGDGLGKAGSDFAKFLKDAIQQVDGLQKNADAASAALATGQVKDIHTVMIALEKANLSLSMTVQVRNKVLDAYNEIMRMQM